MPLSPACLMNTSKTLSSLGSVLASAPLETRKIARRAAAAATYGAARPTTSTGPSLLHAGERDPDQQNVLAISRVISSAWRFCSGSERRVGHLPLARRTSWLNGGSQ